RELIRLYLAAGQPDAALRSYRELERVLERELDAAPGPATQELVRGVEPGSQGAGEQRSRGAEGQREPDLFPSAPSPPCPSAPLLPCSAPAALEPVGGAVPLGSLFYVVRTTDGEFSAAVARRDSIVLVKGPRQVGKTSLLARGLQQAREAGHVVALSHFQML